MFHISSSTGRTGAIMVTWCTVAQCIHDSAAVHRGTCDPHQTCRTGTSDSPAAHWPSGTVTQVGGSVCTVEKARIRKIALKKVAGVLKKSAGLSSSEKQNGARAEKKCEFSGKRICFCERCRLTEFVLPVHRSLTRRKGVYKKILKGRYSSCSRN
jgi:hypothetical protein